MTDRYFIVVDLVNVDGQRIITPLMNYGDGVDDTIAEYPSYSKALEVAREHPLCKSFVFKIFNMGPSRITK